MKVWKQFENRGMAHLNNEPNFIAGMECEIESVQSRNNIGDWQATQDGSLRNSGVEFISQPLPKESLLSQFSYLHEHIEYVDYAEAFSQRTSVHVHVNCRSLELTQVRSIVLLYALFEPFFFALCEPQRRDNIHCVALTDTHLPASYANDLNTMVHHWHKYTALNLLPLRELGTIEFRHLQGTDNFELVSQWLTLLENLWQAGQANVFDRDLLTSNDRLRSLWGRLFGHCPQIMAMSADFEHIIANSLIDVKLSFA